MTVGAPQADGVSGRFLVQGSAAHDFGDAIGAKTAGIVSWRENNLDATVGAAYEARGAFYDAQGRRVGINLTQGELMDSKSWSLFGRFGYQVGDSGRLSVAFADTRYGRGRAPIHGGGPWRLDGDERCDLEGMTPPRPLDALGGPHGRCLVRGP